MCGAPIFKCVEEGLPLTITMRFTPCDRDDDLTGDILVNTVAN